MESPQSDAQMIEDIPTREVILQTYQCSSELMHGMLKILQMNIAKDKDTDEKLIQLEEQFQELTRKNREMFEELQEFAREKDRAEKDKSKRFQELEKKVEELTRRLDSPHSPEACSSKSTVGHLLPLEPSSPDMLGSEGKSEQMDRHLKRNRIQGRIRMRQSPQLNKHILDSFGEKARKLSLELRKPRKDKANEKKGEESTRRQDSPHSPEACSSKSTVGHLLPLEPSSPDMLGSEGKSEQMDRPSKRNRGERNERTCQLNQGRESKKRSLDSVREKARKPSMKVKKSKKDKTNESEESQLPSSEKITMLEQSVIISQISELKDKMDDIWERTCDTE